MNKRADFSNLGGFPLEQDTLDFMQQSYRGALAAMASLCGSKSILYGVELVAGNYTNGWIAYNGELIPFIGAVAATDVVITETPAVTQADFEDGTSRDVYFTKTATCGSTGGFPMSELVPLLSFQNTWLPGDIKQKHVNNAYVAANFDGSGFGLNREKGWRIMSAVYPNSAGRVFVNIDPADADFDETGKLLGTKTITLTGNQSGIQNHDHSHTGSSISSANLGLKIGANQDNHNLADTFGAPQGTVAGGAKPAIDAHSNVQPSYAILTLIKL